MSLISRVLAAGGLLAVPALLAVGSAALSRPAEVPPVEPQTVVVDLARTTEQGSKVEGSAATTPPESGSPTDELAVPSSPEPAPSQSVSPQPAPSPDIPVPAPAPAPAPVAPPQQETPGLVERQVLGDDDADDDDWAGDGDGDDGVEFDDDDDAGVGGED